MTPRRTGLRPSFVAAFAVLALLAGPFPAEAAKARKTGPAMKSACIDCHNEHEVLPSTDDSSMTSRGNIASMCEKCHLNNAEVRQKVAPSATFIESYEKSVHGQARGSQPL